jgi:antitoxin (DNA-binding transcriptional repressor) of toxin-antitoxin stability system
MSRFMNSSTTTIGIGQFRSDALNYLRRARAGETFRVLRRGHPVAELRSIRHIGLGDAARISVSAARTQPRFFDRVAAGEVIAIVSKGETIAALHPCSEDISQKEVRNSTEGYAKSCQRASSPAVDSDHDGPCQQTRAAAKSWDRSEGET